MFGRPSLTPAVGGVYLLVGRYHGAVRKLSLGSGTALHMRDTLLLQLLR